MGNMNKKVWFTSILAIAFIAVVMSSYRSESVSFAMKTDSSVTDVMLNSFSPRNFSSDPVSMEDLEVILKCGIKAPSAANRQPWKFIVVRDFAVMQQMITNVTEGNVLITVCGPEAQGNSTADFDCGLATENMTVAAQSLGLGARIYAGPIGNINATMKQTLQIPDGYRAVVVLRVGHIANMADAVSAATPRNSYDEVVTFLK